MYKLKNLKQGSRTLCNNLILSRNTGILVLNLNPWIITSWTIGRIKSLTDASNKTKVNSLGSGSRNQIQMGKQVSGLTGNEILLTRQKQTKKFGNSSEAVCIGIKAVRLAKIERTTANITKRDKTTFKASNVMALSTTKTSFLGSPLTKELSSKT